ncbi:MAG: 2Fe-2S iron-sulfur cluster binding domain-containing protein [bacterium]
MAKTFNVTVRDQQFTVNAGGRLLDAALQGGVDLPYDCRAGQCGACTIELTRGITLGGEVGCGNILACQARVFSNLVLEPPDAPEIVQRKAVVEEVRTLARDVVELTMRPNHPIDWHPGQYMKLEFRGFPARSFSPSAGLADGKFDDRLVFHIKQVKGGLVTPLLGAEIDVGSKLKIEGPFGHAFLRDDHTGRIVLLGSGTGFAPIWAIASAAQRRAPDREIALICGSKDASSFYMETALRRASEHAGTTIKVAIETRNPKYPQIPFGTPADHMPPLSANDIVFAAGGPRMVNKARAHAEEAGARFYADPFAPASRSGTATATGFRRFAQMFGGARARA